MQRRIVKFLLITLVIYEAYDYELDVYEYQTESFGVEIVCPEGHDDECKPSNQNSISLYESARNLLNYYQSNRSNYSFSNSFSDPQSCNEFPYE